MLYLKYYAPVEINYINFRDGVEEKNICDLFTFKFKRNNNK